MACDEVDELVAALEIAMKRREPHKSYTLPVGWFRQTRALIERAKQHECVPLDDVKEVAQ